MEQTGDNTPRETGETLAEPSDRSRWIAAMGYLGPLAFLSLWHAKRDEFIGTHASQGVLLFLFECAAIVVSAILAATVGKIKIVGLVIIGFFDLVAGLAALSLMVVGFVKALFGEDWRMPFLGQFRDRVPGIRWERE